MHVIQPSGPSSSLSDELTVKRRRFFETSAFAGGELIVGSHWGNAGSATKCTGGGIVADVTDTVFGGGGVGGGGAVAGDWEDCNSSKCCRFVYTSAADLTIFVRTTTCSSSCCSVLATGFEDNGWQ